MISIIMPAYNEENNIAKAIDSIIRQTVNTWELIVVNDASLDNTADIVEEYVNKYDNIKFINSPNKIGKVAAYNWASKYIIGEWVYFMGADDTLPHNALAIWEKYIEKLDYRKKIALRGRMKIVSKSTRYNNLILPRNRNKRNYSGPLTLMSITMQKFILPIPEHLPNEDNWWSLCIKYFADSEIFIDDIVVFYNIHAGNSISRNSSFEVFSKKYHLRYLCREDFINRYRDSLSSKQIDDLKYELKLENLRYNNKSFNILFSKHDYFLNRIRLFILSSPFLYYVKLKFDRYLLGY